MLRVLQVTQYLQVGGLETLVVQMCCNLKQLGVEVELLCFNEPDPQYAAVLEGCEIKCSVIQEKSRLNIDFFKEIISFIRSNCFDVVHTHSGCHLNTAFAAKIAGVSKVVYTAHGMPIFRGIKDRLEDILAAFLTDYVISVSDEIDSFLKDWFVFSFCDYATIINGVDISRFTPISSNSRKTELLKKYKLPSNRILFGSVGRLAPEKNYAMVLRVLKKLISEGYDDIGFVLVGDGPQMRMLSELARKLNISDHIYFLGTQYEIDEILPLFRFFVLSSLTEGTSISLLEAQACGIPAIVTMVGGNCSVIEAMFNGFLCPSNDDQIMANHMKTLIDDSELSNSLGAKARELVEQKYSVSSVTEKYLEIYKK